MKKWNRFALMLVTAVVLVVFSAGASGAGEPMVCYRYNSYVFDASDPAVVAGVYENVFVARVMEKTGNRPEADEALFPYTVYTVEILRTLKGSLEAGTTQVLYKEGGVNADGLLCVNVGDEQPVVGGYYVFLTSPEEDGGRERPAPIARFRCSVWKAARRLTTGRWTPTRRCSNTRRRLPRRFRTSRTSAAYPRSRCCTEEKRPAKNKYITHGSIKPEA